MTFLSDRISAAPQRSSPRRRAGLLWAAWGLALAVLCAGSPGALAAEKAPDFTLKDLSGQKVTLSSFEGKKPVLLGFWASWCPYCRRQIPNLISLRKKFAEEELAILGVNVGENRLTAAAFADAHGINYTTLLDKNSAVSNLYGADGIPYFVLIDRDGRIVSTGHDASGLESQIRSLI